MTIDYTTVPEQYKINEYRVIGLWAKENGALHYLHFVLYFRMSTEHDITKKKCQQNLTFGSTINLI
jgi:hypothetical protein